MSRIHDLAEPVRAGTAEQLARLAHFTDSLDYRQVEELRAVAFWILGDVGDKAAVWAKVVGPARRLWYLVVDDFDDRDLDELSEFDYFPGIDPETASQARLERTRERLVREIEHAVFIARYEAREAARAAARRAHRDEVEARIHPAGAR